MRRLAVLLAAVVLIGCKNQRDLAQAEDSEKELAELVIKNPDLVEFKNEELPIELKYEGAEMDTTVAKADTIIVETEKVRTEIITVHDSVYVYTECKEEMLRDTIQQLRAQVMMGAAREKAQARVEEREKAKVQKREHRERVIRNSLLIAIVIIGGLLLWKWT